MKTIPPEHWLDAHHSMIFGVDMSARQEILNVKLVHCYHSA